MIRSGLWAIVGWFVLGLILAHGIAGGFTYVLIDEPATRAPLKKIAEQMLLPGLILALIGGSMWDKHRKVAFVCGFGVLATTLVAPGLAVLHALADPPCLPPSASFIERAWSRSNAPAAHGYTIRASASASRSSSSGLSPRSPRPSSA